MYNSVKRDEEVHTCRANATSLQVREKPSDQTIATHAHHRIYRTFFSSDCYTYKIWQQAGIGAIDSRGNKGATREPIWQ